MKTNKAKTLAALAIIAAANPDGFTVDARTLQPITTGYAVAVAETQNSFGEKGLANVVDYVLQHPSINAFGGWLDTETNRYYYDGTIVVECLEKAMEIGRANGQIAVFDLTNGVEIRIK